MPDRKKDAAQKHRERMAARSRAAYAASAELESLPKPRRPRRRAKAEQDLWYFLTGAKYFTSPREKPLSAKHKKVVAFLQQCILEGGLYAQAIFRGFAKTTIGERAVLWAALHAHRDYIVLFGFDKPAAGEMLDDIKAELTENDELADDYPEICIPLRAIDNKPQRARSQTFKGELTHAEWKTTRITLPTIPGSKASGVIIRARPRDNARGLRFRRPDGVMARPDFFLADDIQNDASAASSVQVDKQLSLIAKSWLLLSGHHKRLAGVINGTIIEPDDVMDQLTNPELGKYAAWQSQKIQLVEKWADRHEDLWLEKYAELRTTYNADLPGDQARAHKAATAFYRKHRKAMDAGCVVAWDQCYDESEISAIQHAYNLLIDNGAEAFASECQGEPKRDENDISALTKTQVRQKRNGYERGQVPRECYKLTAFVDQQDTLLYWLVAAWADSYTGYVLDYGAWPDQRRSYFKLRDARRTLRKVHRGKDTEGALYAGLSDLTALLLTKSWDRVGGGSLTIDRLAIDANYGNRSKLIKSFIVQSPHRGRMLASFGRGIKAQHKPISAWNIADGREKGTEWIVTRPEGEAVPNLIYDSWYWKKRANDALALDQGSKGCVSLYQGDDDTHRMLADHVKSNLIYPSTVADRTVFESELKPNEEDHLWDCLVGAQVLASVCGIRREEDVKPKKARKRKKVKYL